MTRDFHWLFTAVALRTSGFLFRRLLLFSLVARIFHCSLYTLCQSLLLSVLLYVTPAVSHTHTHTHTQSLPGPSCGNRLCPCKSWLRVINQASQASGITARSDSAVERCHGKRQEPRSLLGCVCSSVCVCVCL